MLPRLTACGRGFYLRRDTKAGGLPGAQSSCPLHHLPSVGGGSDLPQGWEELGRTGTFSECSQREPGLPANLVTSKLVSQILQSLAETCRPACSLHSLWAAKQFLRC